MECSPGAVVLVPMKFTDGSGSKPRPAVVVSSPQYHTARQDAVIVALTSQSDNREYFGDCEIQDWQVAGLKRPTLSKGVISTVKRTAIRRELGRLGGDDYDRVKDSLRSILAL